jgi:8-oxo-dGTP diphosphatase
VSVGRGTGPAEHLSEPAVQIGVGAVVFRRDDVLLIRRGKPPFLGQWSIPGGKPHFGESLIDAAIREVREETSVAIDVRGLIGVFEALPHLSEGRHVVLIDYWAEWTAGEPVAGDDALEAAFVPIGEAVRFLSWDETRRALHAAMKMRTAAKSL